MFIAPGHVFFKHLFSPKMLLVVLSEGTVYSAEQIATNVYYMEQTCRGLRGYRMKKLKDLDRVAGEGVESKLANLVEVCITTFSYLSP